MGYLKIKRVWGLEIALTLVLATSLITPSLAASSNDLRVSIGLQPNEYGTNLNYNPNTLNNGGTPVDPSESSGTPGFTVTDDDKLAESLVGNIDAANEKIKEYQGNVASLKVRLQERIDKCASAYIITITVDDILDNTKKMNDELKSGNNLATDFMPSDDNMELPVNNTNPDEKPFEYDEVIKSSLSIESQEKMSSLDFDIGGIGEHARSVVSTHLQLITPYGFTKDAADEKFENSKLLGIDLGAMPEEQIISQWNGVVVDVGPDDSGSFQYIRVYHGNSTYTVYSHVYPLEGIFVGTYVKSGQPICLAADTRKYEPDKENHILYQVRLNGDYINPLLIYGSRGQKIYERWLTSYAYDNVVESGEEYFHKNEETSEVKEDELVKDVIFPDFNTES